VKHNELLLQDAWVGAPNRTLMAFSQR